MAVEGSLDSGDTRFVIIASDVSPGSLEKLRAKPRALGIPVYFLALTREELGKLLGKGERAAGAVRNGSLAEALELDLCRLMALAGP